MAATEHLPRERLEDPRYPRRALGRTALVGFALFVTTTGTFAPEQAPEAGTATATAAEIRRFAVEEAATIRLNMIAGLASVVLLVLFVVELGRLVRQSRPDSIGPAMMTSLVTAIAANTILVTAVSAIFGRPAELAAVSDRTVLTLYDVLAATQWIYTLVVVGPCMVLVGLASWLALRHRLCAPWVGWAGFVLVLIGAASIAGLVLPASQIDPFVFALFGWWLWPLAISAALAARWWRTR